MLTESRTSGLPPTGCVFMKWQADFILMSTSVQEVLQIFNTYQELKKLWPAFPIWDCLWCLVGRWCDTVCISTCAVAAHFTEELGAQSCLSTLHASVLVTMLCSTTSWPPSSIMGHPGVLTQPRSRTSLLGDLLQREILLLITTVKLPERNPSRVLLYHIHVNNLEWKSRP